MVFFKDKNGSSFSVSQPAQYLSSRAIDRRNKQDLAVTIADLPVNESYVQQIKDAGASAFFRTRWMNGVLVQCNASLVPVLENLDVVDHVELVAPNTRLQGNGRRRKNLSTKDADIAPRTLPQLQMIGLNDMQSAGYRGESIHIAIFDAGFDGVNESIPFKHIFDEGRLDIGLSKDFVRNSDNIFQYDEHGTEVFSVIAAYQEGVFTGGSYKADYQLYVTEDVSSEYRIEEYNWLFAAERADSAGVDVINSSLGYYDFDDASMNYVKSDMDGKTTVITKAAKLAADRGIVVVCSAGNEGNLAWQIISAPADAVDVLSVGSVTSAGQRSSSSSIGPSADSRTKPDVAAMGVNTSVIQPDGSLGFASGTSLASPLVTSLVAGVWQRYPELSNKQLMDAVRQSASQATTPDNLLGYGIPNFKAIVNYLERTPQENTFDVYPNPVVADTFVIRPNDPIEVSACRMEIMSSNGQVIYNSDINFSWLERSFTATLAHHAPGIYFVRLWWNNKRYAFKLAKQ